MAVKNERLGKKIDTVLFFDEANTTDALGMIKEIIVDRSCNGRPLSDNLKFVVACNRIGSKFSANTMKSVILKVEL